MAYNTKPIVTDKDGNPISQYYNPETDSYEPVEGQAGANKVVLYNADGTENNSLSLQPILDKLSQLTGTVIDEETRKSNEIIRQDNEQLRVQLYNDLMAQLDRIEQIQEQVPETVLEAINSLRDELGNLEDLETIDKSSIINAINEINQALLTHQQNTNQEIGQVASDLAAHKAENMPHQFINHKENITYKFGFQVSVDGKPQIIYEEVV